MCVLGGELETWLNVAQGTAYVWVKDAAAAGAEAKPGLACVNLRSDANETKTESIKNPLGGSDEVEVAVVAGHNLLSDLLKWSE